MVKQKLPLTSDDCNGGPLSGHHEPNPQPPYWAQPGPLSHSLGLIHTKVCRAALRPSWCVILKHFSISVTEGNS